MGKRSQGEAKRAQLERLKKAARWACPYHTVFEWDCRFCVASALVANTDPVKHVMTLVFHVRGFNDRGEIVNDCRELQFADESGDLGIQPENVETAIAQMGREEGSQSVVVYAAFTIHDLPPDQVKQDDEDDVLKEIPDA